MKKLMVLFAVSFFLVFAGNAQTNQPNKRTDTTTNPQKMSRKNMHKGKRMMDSTNRGNSSLYPMNNGGGRADSTNSGNGTITPNQMPAQPLNPAPGTTPTPAPAPHK